MAVGSFGYVTGYVEWNEQEAHNCRRNLAGLNGLTPESVRTLAIDHVNRGGQVEQVVETSPQHPDHEFWYKVILLIDGVASGVFVELRLTDDDPDNPAVSIVSAHRQGV